MWLAVAIFALLVLLVFCAPPIMMIWRLTARQEAEHACVVEILHDLKDILRSR